MNEEHTISLLKECNSGCKMALDSINQILQHVEDQMLEHTILEAREEHEMVEKTLSPLYDSPHCNKNDHQNPNRSGDRLAMG